MKTIRNFVVLGLAVCMLWGMSASAFAATSDEAGETSAFTFTNEGTENTTDTTDGTTGTSGTTGGTSGGTSGSNGSSGTSSAKTADVNTSTYAATAAIAGAGAATLLGVSLSRKRRYGKGGGKS